VACAKGWVSKRNAKMRVQHAETYLALKLEPKDWQDVRFSDKVHCRVGPQGKLRIIRKPRERYCSDCIQEQLNRDDKRDWETCHIWGAVGYNFKSDLTFYNTPGNQNGKLSLKVYCDSILKPVVSHGLNASAIPLFLKKTTTVDTEEAQTTTLSQSGNPEIISITSSTVHSALTSLRLKIIGR
jgi:hypothetical protein